MKEVWCFILFSVFTLVACAGGSKLAPFPYVSDNWNNSENKILSDEYVRSSLAEIGTTTFDELKEKLGNADTYRVDRKSYTDSLLCYKSAKFYL